MFRPPPAAAIALGLVAIVLLLISVFHAIAAIYFGWRSILQPGWAHLASAGCLGLLGALCILIQSIVRWRHRALHPPSKNATAPLMRAARAAFRQRPALAILAALGLGVIAEQAEKRSRRRD